MIKRILISGIMLLLLGVGKAQFRFGLTAGALQSRISVDSEYVQYEYRDIIISTWQGYPGYGSSDRTHIAGASSSATSWYSGFVFDYFFSDGLAIRWKLLLQNPVWKGQFVETGASASGYGPPPFIPRHDTVTGNDRYSLQYITLPVNIVFFASLKKARLYFGAGGYLAYGISGLYKVNITHSTFPEIGDSLAEISFNPNTNDRLIAFHANRVDMGLNVCAGIEFRNGLFLDFNYSLGVKDVLTDRYGFQAVDSKNYDISLPNRIRMFGIGLGYFITGKKN